MVRPMTLDEAKIVYPLMDDEVLQRGIDEGYFLKDGSTYVIDDMTGWELIVKAHLFCQIVKEGKNDGGN